MSQYGMGMPPQLPFMPMGGGPGSFAGSDYGGGVGIPMMPTPMGYQNTGSMYGIGMMAPRNTMAPNFTGGGWGGSQAGSATGPMSGPLPPIGGVGSRPMSSFSMATTMNPFMGPSQNADPSNDELYNALKHYLSTQDLMTVTKKCVISVLLAIPADMSFRTAREAIAAQFPKADLTSRKDFLNKSIDSILSES
jgi:chitin synthase